METPPIQQTMEGHSEDLTIRQRPRVRFAALASAIFVLGAAAFFISAFMAQPKVVAQTQTASVVDALAVATAFSNVSLVAQSAYVMDIDTDYVYFKRNENAQLPLASLTKVPLVLAVAEVLSPETILTVPFDTAYSSTAGTIRAGTQWRAKDLMSYTLVASSNDGASVLSDSAEAALSAKYSSGGTSASVDRMNQIAHELGLSTMYFLNPTGLDESTTQAGAFGSAKDVARLFAHAAQSEPGLFEDTSKAEITITAVDGTTAKASNTDRLLDQVPGMIMGKTGTTDLAGGNLAIVYASGGHRYVAVVLNSTPEGRFSDMLQLVSATQAIPEPELVQ